MSITPGGALYYLILFLIFGNLFAFFIGVMMLTMPRRLGALFKLTNRWISTRQATKPLEKAHQTDRVMLRYPRVLGAILLASAALILIKGTVFIARMSIADGGELISRLYGGNGLSRGAWEVLWLSLVIVIIVGAVLAVVVGTMSLFNLGNLKHWAQAANRWISTRQLTKPLDMPHYHLDKLVNDKPRLWGSLIAVLAFFSTLVLWWFVLHA